MLEIANLFASSRAFWPGQEGKNGQEVV